MLENSEDIQTSRLEIRLTYELKELFKLWCTRNKTTPSERLRELIERDVDEVRRVNP